MPSHPRRSVRRRRAQPKVPEAPAIPLKKAVLYARVSSAEQEKEGYSIPAQQKLLRQYAADHDIHVEMEFTDIETAKKAGRTHFMRMMDFIHDRPEVRHILVEKTDRLYRNLRDWVSLDDMPDLVIHLVKEGTVLSDDSRSSEKFIHGIKVLMAKNYIDNLSEETKKGLKEKASQGYWPGRAPLGYKNVMGPEGKRIMVLDKLEAPLVRQMFECYASGHYSLKGLTKKVREFGLVNRKSRKPLPRATLHHMLNNPLYMGDILWVGERYRGKHPPIVDFATFDIVQELMGVRSNGSSREQKLFFPLSGLVYCGACWDMGGEYLLSAQIKKKRYIYYHCEECKRRDRAVTYVRQEVLEEAWLKALKTIRIDQRVVTWMRAALRSSHADKMADHHAAIKRLHARYTELNNIIDQAYDDRIAGVITPKFFDAKARDWREEQLAVRRRMEAHEKADTSYMELGLNLLELANQSSDLYEWANDRDKRELLQFLCSNSVWTGSTLEVAWQKPFDLLAQSPSGPPTKNALDGDDEGVFDKWLPLSDSNRRHSD
jgi:site-specific DNA recombinase